MTTPTHDARELDAFIDAHLKEKVLRPDCTRLDEAILKMVLREFATALLSSPTPGTGISEQMQSLINAVRFQLREDPTLPIEPADAREMLDIIEKLQQSPQGQGWKPIESAPKDGTEVIYWNVGQYVSSCVWRDEDEGRAEGWWDDAITEYVTPAGYLMPLPAPPSEPT